MRVAVYGGRGFVGSQVVAGLRSLGVEPIVVTRGDPDPDDLDILINAACPGARYRAEKDPAADFEATVCLTARLLYGVRPRRLVQVSSLSARTTHTAYARHRRAAEALVGDDGLVVRLGPMYGQGLVKGYLLDIANGRPVYAPASTRYAYAPVEWSGLRVAELALTDRTGMVEATGTGYVRLGDIAAAVGSSSVFLPSELHVEDQVGLGPDGPDARCVIDWLSS